MFVSVKYPKRDVGTQLLALECITRVLSIWEKIDILNWLEKYISLLILQCFFKMIENLRKFVRQCKRLGHNHARTTILCKTRWDSWKFKRKLNW